MIFGICLIVGKISQKTCLLRFTCEKAAEINKKTKKFAELLLELQESYKSNLSFLVPEN